MLRKVTDLVLYLCFCILLGTGGLLLFAPKGIDWWALGIHEDYWKIIHIAAGLIMAVAVIEHILINRKWVDKVGLSGSKKRLAALLAVGLLLIFAVPFLPIVV